MTTLKYKEGGVWKTLTMPSALYIGDNAPDPAAKQVWVDTDEVAPIGYYIPPLVSALPAAPFDGQEVRYQSAAMATDGIVWALRYRAAAVGIYKWEFIGGSPLFSEVAAVQTISVAVYGDLGTVGPAVTLPLTGDYIVAHGARMYSDQPSGEAWMSYAVGATAATDADGIGHFNPSPTFAMAEAMERRRNGQTAVTLTAKYRRGAGGASSFEKRWMRAMPVRVG